MVPPSSAVRAAATVAVSRYGDGWAATGRRAKRAWLLRCPVQVLVQCLAHNLAGFAVFSFGPLPQLAQ